MPEFLIQDDGFLTERSAHETAAWYASYSPTNDRLSFEAHLMLTRARLFMDNVSDFSPTQNLTRSRYNFLRVLFQAAPHRLSLNEVSQGLNVSQTNITKLTDGLEKDGYVRRVAHAQDKRVILVELTDLGSSTFESILPRAVRRTEEHWSGLNDDEKKLLIHLLAKFSRHLVGGSPESTIARVQDEITRQPV